MPTKDATFVSVWSDGVTVSTSCKVNMTTKEIFDIVVANVDDLGMLLSEHIILDGCEYPAYPKEWIDEIDELDGSFWYE